MTTSYSMFSEISDPTMSALNSKAVILYQENEFQKAAKCFQQLYNYLEKENKLTIEVAFNLGSALLMTNEPENIHKSLRYLNKASDDKKSTSKHHLRYQAAQLEWNFINKKMFFTGHQGELNEYTLHQWYNHHLHLCGIFSDNLGELKATLENLPETDTYLIVSLGCGWAEEVYALKKILGNALFAKVHYVGIDIDSNPLSKDIGRMAMLNSIYAKSGFQNIKFIKLDATDVENVKTSLPKDSADMIVVRQPNFIKDRRECAATKMLAITCPAIARADGKTIIYTTSYFEDEMRRIQDALNCGGYCSSAEEKKEEAPQRFNHVTYRGEITVYPDQFVYFVKNYDPKPNCFSFSKNTKKENKKNLEVKGSQLSSDNSNQNSSHYFSDCCKNFGVFAIATAVAVTSSAVACYFRNSY
jgi:hypothetical protein